VEGIYLLATVEEFPNQSLVCNIGNGAPVGIMDFISILEKSMRIGFSKEFIDAQKGDVESTHADTTLLETLVDYTPSIGLEKGIPLFVKWYKAYYQIR
jgi:UDP-glucuronate 4-epimerase